MKSQGLTLELLFRLPVWNSEEVGGTLGVEVKFVDIEKNTGGEGGQLDRY